MQALPPYLQEEGFLSHINTRSRTRMVLGTYVIYLSTADYLILLSFSLEDSCLCIYTCHLS